MYSRISWRGKMNPEQPIDDYVLNASDDLRPHTLKFFKIGQTIQRYGTPFVYYNFLMEVFKQMFKKYSNIDSAMYGSKATIEIPFTGATDFDTLKHFCTSVDTVMNEAMEKTLIKYKEKDLSSVLEVLDNIQKLKGSFRLGFGIDIEEVKADAMRWEWIAKYN